MNREDLVFLAVMASEKAAQEILKVYNSGINSVSYKDDSSPLTKADMESNRVINEMLSPTNIPILSEEGKAIPFETRKLWNRYWLVDPLDGTKEFINRNGEFTVNIALMEENRPVGGVIWVPVWNRLYFALKGKGSYLLQDPDLSNISGFVDLCSVSRKLDGTVHPETFTVVASRSHMSEETTNFIEMLEQHFGKADFISRGSSLKFCKVAEGKADIYPRLGKTMEWDTAAGHAIAEEAGCEITKNDLKSPLEYNKENLLNPDFIVWRNDFIARFQ